MVSKRQKIQLMLVPKMGWPPDGKTIRADAGPISMQRQRKPTYPGFDADKNSLPSV